MAERLHSIARNSLLPAISSLHVHVTDRVEQSVDNLNRFSGSQHERERLKLELAA